MRPRSVLLALVRKAGPIEEDRRSVAVLNAENGAVRAWKIGRFSLFKNECSPRCSSIFFNDSAPASRPLMKYLDKVVDRSRDWLKIKQADYER